MYRRMDQKERILYLIAACGLIGSIIFLLGVINQNWYLAGGAVCFARNLPPLRQNGRIYCLKRPVDALPTDGRPLSTSRERLREMEREREPFYRQAAQVVVDNSGPLEQTVAEILTDFGGDWI